MTLPHRNIERAYYFLTSALFLSCFPRSVHLAPTGDLKRRVALLQRGREVGQGSYERSVRLPELSAGHLTTAIAHYHYAMAPSLTLVKLI